MTTTKIYDSIPHVVAFGQTDANGRNPPGPLVDTLHVFAVLANSPLYPEERISIAHDDIGAFSLTSEQAALLEERLAGARADVDAATDSVGPALLESGGDRRCEFCELPIAAGAPMTTFAERGRAFFVHAGRCPTSCGARIARPVRKDASAVVYLDDLCPGVAIGTRQDGTRVCGGCARRAREHGIEVVLDEVHRAGVDRRPGESAGEVSRG